MYLTVSETKNEPEPFGKVDKRSKKELDIDDAGQTKRSADGPRITTRPALYVRRPRTMSTNVHPRSIIREALKQEEVVETKNIQKRNSKDQATQKDKEDYTIVL